MDRRHPFLLTVVLGCSFDSAPEGTTGSSTSSAVSSSGSSSASSTSAAASSPTTSSEATAQASSSGEPTSTTGHETSSSETGAACGDGHLDPDEECDDANHEDGDGCGACMKEFRRVFVTSSLFPGNLGGLEGADNICQTHALQAGFPGLFYAWLSTAESSPSARFVKSAVPYEMVDGTAIANDWADLVDGSLGSAVYLTETGSTAPQGIHPCSPSDTIVIWTGTTTDGTSSGTTCSNWDGSGDASWGRSSDVDQSWTAFCSGPCASASTPLLCFEQ